MERFTSVSQKALLVLFIAVGMAFLGSTVRASPPDNEEETEMGVICTLPSGGGTAHFDASWVFIFSPGTRCGEAKWRLKNACCSGYPNNWGAEVAGWGDSGYEDDGWGAVACISDGGQGSAYATCMCNKHGGGCDYLPIIGG